MYIGGVEGRSEQRDVLAALSRCGEQRDTLRAQVERLRAVAVAVVETTTEEWQGPTLRNALNALHPGDLDGA